MGFVNREGEKGNSAGLGLEIRPGHDCEIRSSFTSRGLYGY